MLLSFLKNRVTEKNTRGAGYHAALLCLVVFLVSSSSRQWSVCFCVLDMPFLPISQQALHLSRCLSLEQGGFPG